MPWTLTDRRIGGAAAPPPPRPTVPMPGVEVEKAPPRLDDIVGQAELVDRLQLIFAGAKARGVEPPHVLLSGPPGYGKTTLAGIVAAELGVPMVKTSGPAVGKPEAMVKVLVAINEESVLFIDEIHRLKPAVEETLYEAMEEGTISYVTGGKQGRAVTRTLPPIHLVGATTMPGNISAPLRDRFGWHGEMGDYSVDDLTEIVSRIWAREGVAQQPGAARVIALRGKGVPRIARDLSSLAADYAAGVGDGTLSESVALAAMERFGVVEGGFTAMDLRILRALADAGVAVGLEQLSQVTEIDAKTITNQYEGPLIRAGLVVRTGIGRIATTEAYELLASLKEAAA